MSEKPSEFRPCNVDSYRGLVCRLVDHRSTSVPRPMNIASNISYSLQYVEFLSTYYRKYDHHFTIDALLVKDFIIVCCGILEAVFYYVVKSRGWARTTDLELIKVSKGNPFEHGGDKIIIHTHMLRVLPEPVFEQMTFDQMAKKVESKRVFNDSGLYQKLAKMRKLRNHIHLQSTSQDFTKTDFNAFSRADFWEMSELLWLVLSSHLFNPTSEQLELIAFLKKPAATS
jgi:hypothetical protein